MLDAFRLQTLPAVAAVCLSCQSLIAADTSLPESIVLVRDREQSVGGDPDDRHLMRTVRSWRRKLDKVDVSKAVDLCLVIGEFQSPGEQVVVGVLRGVGGPFGDVSTAQHKRRFGDSAADFRGKLLPAGQGVHRVDRRQQMLTVAVDRNVLIRPAEKRQSRFVRVRSASGGCYRQQAQDRADRHRDPTSSCDHNVSPFRHLIAPHLEDPRMPAHQRQFESG